VSTESQTPRTGDLRWRDGSEDLVVEILRSAKDRSSASDELAAHVTDWPTRYHFDRARTNLLQPLHLRPGLRILDLGAGTGIMSRFAAERGASVVAVEGDARRAEAAALRCQGLDVDVRHGSIDEIDAADGPFDVALCIGVLEYAGGDPAGFLAQLTKHLTPQGVLTVAIENRFGLAYWLGANEDHLNQPWLGLEGYPAVTTTTKTSTVRTHSRRSLAELLAGAGLESQRWLSPSPDYKLPTAILAERIYLEPDAVELVDQLVGPPLDRSRMGGKFEGDERAVNRGILEAGLAPDLANSFLVLAGADAHELDQLCDPSVLAWRFTGDRSQCHLRVRTIRSSSSEVGRTVDRRPTHRDLDTGHANQSSQLASTSWLRLDAADRPPEPWITGPNLEQLALERLRAGDQPGLTEVLRQWSDLIGLLAVKQEVAKSEVHPFLPAGRRQVLPGDHLDFGLDNLAGAGGLSAPVFIDDEWVAVTGVDLELAAIRACWKLASVAIESGTRHRWPLETTVDDLTIEFLNLLPSIGGEQVVGPDPLTRFYSAEAQLRVIALAGTAADHVAQIRAAGRRSLANRASGTGPSTGLRGWLSAARRRRIIGPVLTVVARFVRRMG